MTRLARTTALLLLVSLPAAAAEKIKIAVLDFVANGASPELANATSGMAANELQRLGEFKVMTSEMVRNLIALERQKQMLGCSEDSSASCMAEVAGALGVDYVVSGKVTRLKGDSSSSSYTLETTLTNVHTASRDGSDIQVAKSEADLLTVVGKSMTKLLSKLLAGRSGSLRVVVSEAGAVIKIDDVSKGTSPLSGSISVPGGPHYLTVEKDGFITFQKEIRIQPTTLVEEEVTLVPSPDFIAEYEARESKYRWGARLTTGAALLSGAAFGYFQYQVGSKFGAVDKPGTFAFHRAAIERGVEIEGDVNHRRSAETLAAEINNAKTMSWISGGVCAAALAGAAYFWIAGDDPDRYEKFHQVAFFAAPGTDGAAASLRITF